MDLSELNWTVEDTCMNAWPSPRQLLFGPWLLRLAGGVSRRTNSVNPLRALTYDPGAVVAACGEVYARCGLPLVFRVPSMASGLDSRLDVLGFAAQDHYCTLFADLADVPGQPDPSVTLSGDPGESWLDLRSRSKGGLADDDRVYREMVACIVPPKAFAAFRHNDHIVSIAYGVVDRKLLVIESVATDDANRQRGFARRTLVQLLLWGTAQGATGACLQVMATNEAARALYVSLGFRTELYRYHYRRQDITL